MDRFLEQQKQPRLNHKEIGNLKGPITSNEIELVSKKLPTTTKKAQELMASLRNSIKYFKKNIHPYQMFQKKKKIKSRERFIL